MNLYRCTWSVTTPYDLIAELIVVVVVVVVVLGLVGWHELIDFLLNTATASVSFPSYVNSPWYVCSPANLVNIRVSIGGFAITLAYIIMSKSLALSRPIHSVMS